LFFYVYKEIKKPSAKRKGQKNKLKKSKTQEPSGINKTPKCYGQEKTEKKTETTEEKKDRKYRRRRTRKSEAKKNRNVHLQSRTAGLSLSIGHVRLNLVFFSRTKSAFSTFQLNLSTKRIGPLKNNKSRHKKTKVD